LAMADNFKLMHYQLTELVEMLSACARAADPVLKYLLGFH